jgi:hypothetical protein
MKALAIAALVTIAFGSGAIGITANSGDGGVTESTLPVTEALQPSVSPDASQGTSQEAGIGVQSSYDDDDEDWDDDRHDGDRDHDREEHDDHGDDDDD